MTAITAERLDELSFVGDPPADAVVEQHAREHPGDPKDLVGSIAQHLELPPEQRSPAIDAYLAEQPPLPSWAEPPLLQRGAAFFELVGLEIGSALFCASLPEAYAGARGARVLTLTAQMVTNPVRRVYETAQMIFDAMAADGLTVGTGSGYRDIRRVRLMHAAVRYLILHGVDHTDDATVARGETGVPPRVWYRPGGTPLNQEDLLGTLLTFTTIVFDALDRQGIGYEPADAAAYLHRWCVVAELLGIQPGLLPLDLDEARALRVLIRERQQRASLDAPLLGGHLVGALRATVRIPGLRELPATLIRWYCGDPIAAINGISGSGWTALLFDPFRRAMRLVGLVEQHDKMVRVLTRHLTAAILCDFMAHARGNRPPFTIPRQLDAQVRHTERRWRL